MLKKWYVVVSSLYLLILQIDLHGMMTNEEGSSSSEEGGFVQDLNTQQLITGFQRSLENLEKDNEALRKLVFKAENENQLLQMQINSIQKLTDSEREKLKQSAEHGAFADEFARLADIQMWEDDKKLSEQLKAFLLQEKVLEISLEDKMQSLHTREAQVVCHKLLHSSPLSLISAFAVLGLAIKLDFISYNDALKIIAYPSYWDWLLKRSIEICGGLSFMLLDFPADYLFCLIENSEGFSDAVQGLLLREKIEQFLLLMRTSFYDSQIPVRNKKRWFKKPWTRVFRFVCGFLLMYQAIKNLYPINEIPTLPDIFTMPIKIK